MMTSENRRQGDRRRIERREPKPAVNVRYEDKDKPKDWAPNRIRRGRRERDPLDSEYIADE